MKKERADSVIFSRGLASSRRKAQALIMAGRVFAGDRRIEKPGVLLEPGQVIHVENPLPYVGRGGLKLEEALDAFAVSVSGKVAADLGSSTGGFTDCLLKRGAKRVFAVDVDTRQLDWRLKNDPRVVLLEKNARYLTAGDFSENPEIVTMDLSFISVLKVLPALKAFLTESAILALIKPQFEAGKGKVGKKGVIREPAHHEGILKYVLEEAGKLGFALHGLIKSSIPGQKGNREFFAWWTPGKDPESQGELEALIKEVVRHE